MFIHRCKIKQFYMITIYILYFFLPITFFFLHKNMLLGLIYVDMNSSGLFTKVQGADIFSKIYRNSRG